MPERQTIPLENPHRMGAAWFAKNAQTVHTADEELAVLQQAFAPQSLVIRQQEQQRLSLPSATLPIADASSTIKLTSYEPNHLTYQSESATGGAVLFSEIYYPGWQLFVDGKEQPLARANYVFRTAVLPAGSHVVEMRFDPTSLHVTEGIAFTFMTLILAGCIILLARTFYLDRKRKAALP